MNLLLILNKYLNFEKITVKTKFWPKEGIIRFEFHAWGVNVRFSSMRG
jgi:hypothetical protein